MADKEYIERGAVLKILENSLNFSKNELDVGEYRIGCIAAIEDDIGNVKHIPSVDVVEVVRCKDCAHYIEMKGYDYNGRKRRACLFHSSLRNENAYCSDGIRRAKK